jgi:Fur family zinc uptake transcriptional regulator
MLSPESRHPQPSDARQALEQAEILCQQRGARLTDLRRRVLEIIWNSPTPLGAYAILDVLRDDGRQGAPPTVYRALDFLLEQGLIHRLASLNVFVGCRQPDNRHGGQFLICRDCGQVNELSSPAVEELLRAEAAVRDFEVLAQMVEVLGRCPDCQRGAVSHAG